RLDRQVAIKLWNTDGQDAQAGLLREAQVLAKLSHPNVVSIYECDVHEGRLFIAMEYVDGHDGHHWRAWADPDWREVVRVGAAAGRGLAAAHAIGIVHHDFKPSNLLIGTDGAVKVVDFGLAALGDGPSLLRKYSSGQPGTPSTMAPERLEGRRGDARSDQYSFAATMWWFLFDAFPYSGKTAEQVANEIAVGGPFAVGEYPVPGTPPQVRRVLEKGLALEPEHRYRDMEAFVSALRDAPEWAANRRRRVLQVTAMSAATSMIVGLLGFALLSQSRDGGHTQANQPTEESVPAMPQTPESESSIDEALELLDDGEFQEAEKRWRTWHSDRYGKDLPIYEGSLRTGKAFLAKARDLKSREPALAFRLAVYADNVCKAAQLDPRFRGQLGETSTMLRQAELCEAEANDLWKELQRSI
ncbi:MAG: serine/threonine protein kinase, partial [Myxococcales bacterium]|nr:serine/threonine protein kinase [Myxococcales bacterium]